MLCPKCSTKLKCYNTGSLSNIRTVRKYACLKCSTRYISTEELDIIPMEKKGVPRHLLRWLMKYQKEK